MASSSVSHQGKLASRPAAGRLRQRHLRCSRGLPLCRACHHHHHHPWLKMTDADDAAAVITEQQPSVVLPTPYIYFLFLGLLLLLRLVCLPVVLEIWKCLQRDSRREQSPVFFPPSPPPPRLGREGGKKISARLLFASEAVFCFNPSVELWPLGVCMCVFPH